MVTIPFFTLLFLYFLFVLIFLAFVLINIAHLVHTGTFTLASILVTFFVFASAGLVFFGTWYFLQGVDWQQRVLIWNNAWIGGASGFNQI